MRPVLKSIGLNQLGSFRSDEMSERVDTHDDDCNKVARYTDGIFWLCLCKARDMNTFVGAHYSIKPPSAKGEMK